MNKLMQQFGLYYQYDIEIRSLTADEISMLKRHSDANYIKKVKIQLTTLPPSERWRYRYGMREQYVWDYDVTVYG